MKKSGRSVQKPFVLQIMLQISISHKSANLSVFTPLFIYMSPLKTAHTLFYIYAFFLNPFYLTFYTYCVILFKILKILKINKILNLLHIIYPGLLPDNTMDGKFMLIPLDKLNYPFYKKCLDSDIKI